jgi:hypothetical protein
MKNALFATLAVVVAGGLIASGAYAYGGWNEEAKQALQAGDFEAWKATNPEFANKLSEEKFAYMAEKFEAKQVIYEAIEAGDYEAWKTAMEAFEKPRMTEIITEDNFATFVAMHEAKEAGNIEEAERLASELGLEKMKGVSGRGHGKFGSMRGNCMMAE